MSVLYAQPHLPMVSTTAPELDPVTFEPYPEDAPPVTLGLTYDSEPAWDSGRLVWGLPLWLVVLGGAYVAANYVGGRI